MLPRVVELLGKCGSTTSVLPPTELYNEGWMLRLILDWFDQNRDLRHELSFLPGARWYSEALLPSRFLPQKRGDERAESFTHADGVIGHFSIRPGERGEASLLPTTRQFVVTEAKLGSGLSAGTKNAPDYDQAARNVACMARMIEAAGINPKTLESLAFYVLAPDSQITSGVFENLVTEESIHRKVADRVRQYEGALDDEFHKNLVVWFHKGFEPVLERIDLGILSWESILDLLPTTEVTSKLREFYARCRQFNPQRGQRAV